MLLSILSDGVVGELIRTSILRCEYRRIFTHMSR
jgi:hypothetical protein